MWGRRRNPLIKWRKPLNVDVMSWRHSVRAQLWCSALVFIFLSLLLKDTENYGKGGGGKPTHFPPCQPVPTGHLDSPIALEQLEVKRTVTSD